MTYDDRNFRPNNRQSYSQKKGYSQPYGTKAPPREAAAKPLPKDYVDQAERVIRGIYNDRQKITTSKIRNLLSMVSDVYNVELLRTEDELLPESQTALIMLRIRVVYESGRDEGTRNLVEKAELLEYLKDIGSSREKLINFSHYMEALVAYHRYIIGGKEG